MAPFCRNIIEEVFSCFDVISWEMAIDGKLDEGHDAKMMRVVTVTRFIGFELENAHVRSTRIS